MALIEAYEEQYHGLVKSINEKLDRLGKIGPTSGMSNPVQKLRRLAHLFLIIVNFQ